MIPRSHPILALAVVGALVLGLTPLARGASEQLAAPEQYAASLAVMNSLPQPRFVHFITAVDSQGVGVHLDSESNFAEFEVGFGSAFKRAVAWDTDLRVADIKALVKNESGKLLEIHSPVFKPVWPGAYQWVRYGLQGPVIAPPPISASDDASSTTQIPDSTVIGRVASIAPSAYRIEDGAPEACPGGDPGRHLHLTALRSPEKYPLTDVIVDGASQRICRMSFDLGKSSAFSLTGTFQLDFGESSGYWMVKDGTAHLLFRLFGFGTKHADVNFVYQDVTVSPTASDAFAS
jgi:hypothetical protein